MLACICGGLTSPDAYNLYLMLKTERQKAIFVVIQMYIFFITIASILVNLIGGAWAALLFLIFYFIFFSYCIKTAIPLEGE